MAEQSSEVGDLGCPGVDVSQWKKENTVELYPGHTNSWLVGIVVDKTSNVDQVLGKVKIMLDEAAGGSGVLYPTFGIAKNIDSVKIVKSGLKQFKLSDQKQVWTKLKSPPNLAVGDGEQVLYVQVDFAYRGTVSQVPWPVLDPFSIVLGRKCPLSAKVMLMAAGPSKGEAGERTDSPALVKVVKEHSKPFAFGLGALIGVGVLGYAGYHFWVKGALARRKNKNEQREGYQMDRSPED